MAKDAEYWYQRTVEQLLLMGKSQKTAKTYSREVRVLGRYVDRPLDEIDEEDLRQFILYRRNECKLAGSSMRVLYCGLKTLYREVMGNKWPLLEVLKSHKESRLPIVLHRDDVKTLLDNGGSPQFMTYLRVVYTCGLRLSEARNLLVSDIDGKRGLLHVRGKGSKDRFVPLPRKTYRYLQRYWLLHRNPSLVFPALGRGGNQGSTAQEPITSSSAQSGLRSAVRRAGLVGRKINLHCLRHSYATHLLEAGVSIKTVQEYLGHKTLQHTLIYLHLTTWGKEDANRKVSKLMGAI